MGDKPIALSKSIQAYRTVPITGSTNPLELVPAIAGRRPIVTHLWFTAGGATNLEFNSYNGSSDTALSGTFAADASNPNSWGGQGEPVLIGRAVGDSIRTDNSGTASLVGFAVVVYSHE